MQVWVGFAAPSALQLPAAARADAAAPVHAVCDERMRRPLAGCDVVREVGGRCHLQPAGSNGGRVKSSART
jgi:hypothetical protein